MVATGGLSIPKMGATGLGYEIARQFGLKVVPPRPALVPLVLGGDEAGWTELAGVAAEVEASAEGAKKDRPSGAKAHGDRARSIAELKTPTCQPVPFREKMLVTHRGLSGPAVLQASSYWRPGRRWFWTSRRGWPLRSSFWALKQPGARRDLAALQQALREVLPQRLANHLAEIGAPKGWSNAALEACERRLHRCGDCIRRGQRI